MDRFKLESELVSSILFGLRSSVRVDDLTSLTVMICGGYQFGQGHIGRLPCSIGHYGLELV
jgi:hypothetical protein